MKEIMQARFVPTNYLHSVFDKLTQLKKGFLTVDAYYNEMELLVMQEGRRTAYFSEKLSGARLNCPIYDK
jgi:hypothetical protein